MMEHIGKHIEKMKRELANLEKIAEVMKGEAWEKARDSITCLDEFIGILYLNAEYGTPAQTCESVAYWLLRHGIKNPEKKSGNWSWRDVEEIIRCSTVESLVMKKAKARQRVEEEILQEEINASMREFGGL